MDTQQTPGPQPTSSQPPTHATIKQQPPASQRTKRRVIATMATALAITFVFDRFVCSSTLPECVYGYALPLFWMLCLALVTALHWTSVRRRPYTWLVVGTITALSVWNMLSVSATAYCGNIDYALTSFLAQPMLLMLHCQLADGRYSVWHPFQVARDWLTGWLMQPFANLGRVFESFTILVRSADSSGKRSKAREIGMAMLVSVPLLLVIIPLLASADRIFRYELASAIGHPDLAAITIHTLIVIVPWPFLCSLLLGLDIGAKEPSKSRHIVLSPATTVTVLSVILVVYALFCSVQLRFLFAGALTDGSISLPDGLTYSAYARDGFFQLLAVAAINLAVFGIALISTPRTPWLNATLGGLLAVTAIMLASAALRLGLYIGAYGLTWLRYASLTFIALLAIAIVLCAIRMFTSRLPLVATLAALVMVWYVALGFSNPDWVCGAYNATHGFSSAYSPDNPATWMF
ncbi:DUF4153 domain-containing protein [Bifidobacterium sp.]|uniref:DUF4153 domain-containing protein n=1 Tax=Bifidobacterium sp. TaxID=41200 RepID=UPI003D7E06C0